MFEFADIARPDVRGKLSHGAGVDAFDGGLPAHFLQKVVHQQRQVLGMLHQRRGADQKNRQPVVEIGAKGARLGVLRQRPVGGCHNPHIHLDRLVVPHALQLAAFHKAQQLGLQRQRHLANLIQKQRPPVGRLDPPHPSMHRAGEGTPRMPEKFSFKQCFRNSCAINCNKRFFTSHR